ncbi:TIGR03986 family CRISPR-associated RAMP protein [Megasphaera sp.]|uniref:TIGR03986 family type III CRISPR-associated RAMP protein n=1 Tax=Megasphaera sp. TaxID=2023260 RepID=UPI0027B9D578|nr:TIGR03986 family CRISPR-associated RAMP protein [Megasphaera sp.]
MASIGDILKAKKEDRDPKKQQPQKPKKQKKVSITLDTSLDKKPRGNYRGQGGGNSYQGGGNSYQGGKKEKQQAPSLKPHQEYVDNANAPKAAVSAYNFVPFTRTVLASPLDAMKNDFRGYIESQETYSGTLSLELSNVTPLFIGGNGSDEAAFFSPNGEPLIPGSTLRGMVRSLFKIVTAGTMRRDEDFVDRHLYFRCLMAPKSMPQLKELNAYYVKRMSTEHADSKSDKPVKRAKPGFLYRLEGDGTYYLAPCEMKSIKAYEYGTIPKESQVDWNPKEKIAYILTGNQKNKKFVRCLSNPDWNEAEAVPEQLIQEYRDDTRRKGVDLLNDSSSAKQQAAYRGGSAKQFSGRSDIDFLVPCFYTKENGEITSFGHGRSYRIPYRKSVGDRLPEALQANPDVVDFADAVFGHKEEWAGRVSFEDARLTSPVNLGPKAWVKPLLGANPTSYQLYLTQNDWPPAHWDSDAPVELRGYKMYWHKNIGNSDWQAKPEQQNGSITKKIEPLLAGNAFSSAIHFRNLTAVELGALLKVFHLQEENEDIVYKIGMGKSLGMGSVRIKSSLHLDSDRYGALFDGGQWQESQQPANAGTFIDAFDAYVRANLGPAEASYQRSLKNLRIMLDWQHTKRPGWVDKVSAAGSDKGTLKGGVAPQFTDRAVLDKPDKIIK